MAVRSAAATSETPYLVLTAATLDATGLSYAGTATVTEPAGSVRVLRFTLTSGSLTGLKLTQTAGSSGITSTADTATIGNARFAAVQLDATLGGSPISFTADNPPTTTFPSEFALHDVSLTAITFSSDVLTVNATGLSARD